MRCSDGRASRPLSFVETDHGPRLPARALPQHRHHGAHRRREDDHHRADPLLHRHHPQDGGRRRREHHHRLDGAGARARDHHHLGGDHRLLGPQRSALPDQHHRHPGARGLHHRGGALASRAGRRHRGVRCGQRGRAPERDGVAPGGPLRGAAHLLHQQDGPPGGRLRHVGPEHQGEAAGQRGAGPDSLGRRGAAPGGHRPGADEGHHLRRVGARKPLRGGGHPGRRCWSRRRRRGRT